MECISVFINLGERVHSAGVRGEEEQGCRPPPQMTDWRRGELWARLRPLGRSLPLSPCHQSILGKLQVPSLGSHLLRSPKTQLGAEYLPFLQPWPGILPPSPSPSFPFLNSLIIPSLLHICILCLLLSSVLPLFPSLFIQLASERKPF